MNNPSKHIRTVLQKVAVAGLLLALAFYARPVEAAMCPAEAPAVQELSEETVMSLITILPGTQVHALFGHSALRVRDPVRGIDEIYNYGTFDFSDPFFVPRFMHGQMDYFLSIQSARTIPLYAEREGRPVIEQILNLSQEQIETIYRFVQVNALPENRYYRYDFFFDNCSTRILDLFEDNLVGEVEFNHGDPPDESFRDLLRPYLIGQPFLHTGIDALLGRPTDRLATPREAAFLPDHLMYLFDEAEVEIDGERMPLVAQTDTLEWIPGYERAEAELPWPAIFGWLILLAAGLLSLRGAHEGSVQSDLLTRVFDAILYGFAGLLGFIIVYMWFISEHTVTEMNLNLLWAWPTHLIALVALFRGVEDRWLTLYLAATAGLTMLFVVLWPFWPQVFPAMALPLALALVVRSAGIAYVRRRQLVVLQPA